MDTGERIFNFEMADNSQKISLPELRSSYHDAFGGSGGFAAPRIQAVAPLTPRPPSRGGASRLDYLEERVINQERASQSLVDRAMRIKEDVIENLNITHSTWQGEKKQRELLQEHIRAISDLVHKMNRDIQILEKEVRFRDVNLLGASNSLKGLELQQVATLTDIKGRIARCDASIMKLVGDQKGLADTLKDANSRSMDNYMKMQDKMQALEMKIAEAAQRHERKAAESVRQVEYQKAGNNQEITNVETKLRSMIKELRSEIDTEKSRQGVLADKMAERTQLALEKQNQKLTEALVTLERKMEDTLTEFRQELQSLRVEMKHNKADVMRHQEEGLKTVNGAVRSALAQQNDAISKVKTEGREGFATVHASLTSSKQVLEGKLALHEEKMKKELGQIRRMVVLV